MSICICTCSMCVYVRVYAYTDLTVTINSSVLLFSVQTSRLVFPDVSLPEVVSAKRYFIAK